MNKLLYIYLIVISFLFVSFPLFATTIVPYSNLGEMAKATESVVFVKAISNFEITDNEVTRFRTQLRVISTVKGDLQPGNVFEVQHWHQIIGDLEREIWGDLELKEGENYFLFLDFHPNGYWQPKMLSYAAFQEIERNNENVLVPFGLGAEVQILQSGNGQAAEPLQTYYRGNLINHLRAVVNDDENWNKKEVETPYQIATFTTAQTKNTNPGHCTHVSSSPFARWPNMETTALPIRYAVAGDSGCPNAATQIGNAITDMSTQYGGINITNAGTHAFVPTCAGEGATDNEFTTWVATNLGGSRNVVIQFDDPCSEIGDLGGIGGCEGTLAVGGLYFFGSTHSNCGISWRNAAYGYVLVNNGAGACLCVGASTDYQDLITHEMSHSLNVGHTAGEGTANMNPLCCVDITALDVACLNYMYPLALPVELSSFNGRLFGKTVRLDWRTESETNNDFFTIERSIDGRNFESIEKIKGAGDSSIPLDYQSFDQNPVNGLNYYRLKQTDFDGSFTYSKNIAISFGGKVPMKVIPNPVRKNDITLEYNTIKDGSLEVEILDIAGKAMTSQTYSTERGLNQFDINISDYKQGVYILRTRQGTSVETIKFVKL